MASWKQQQNTSLQSSNPKALQKPAFLPRLLYFLFRWVLRALTFCVIIAAVTIFFKVETIDIQGLTHYTTGEVASAITVKKGDNLFLWDKNKVSKTLLERFPYIEEVELRRQLPNTLNVSVTEAEPAIAVLSDTGYFLLSDKGKVLEQSANDNGLPVAFGVSLLGYTPGQTVMHTSDAYADALLNTVSALSEQEMLANVDFINLQSLTDIRIGYLGRFDIRIGTEDDVQYKLQYAGRVTEERLSPSDIGRLYWDSKGRLHFVPDTAENVAQSGLTGFLAGQKGSVILPFVPNAEGELTDGVENGDGTTDESGEDTEGGDLTNDESGDGTEDGSEDEFSDDYSDDDYSDDDYYSDDYSDDDYSDDYSDEYDYSDYDEWEDYDGEE